MFMLLHMPYDDPAAHQRWLNKLVDRMQLTICPMPAGREELTIMQPG
jgi:hypothetical protein